MLKIQKYEHDLERINHPTEGLEESCGHHIEVQLAHRFFIGGQYEPLEKLLYHSRIVHG